MKWNDVSYLIRGPLNRRIVEALEKEILTPVQIAKKTNMARSNVGTRLIKLKQRNLVECLNEEDKIGRLYRITEYGKGVLKEARKINLLP